MLKQNSDDVSMVIESAQRKRSHSDSVAIDTFDPAVRGLLLNCGRSYCLKMWPN